MGNEPNVTATLFPKQGAWLGRRTRVLFHYGGPELIGTIVRDDDEAPYRTIIKLDDGRYVLTTECQHSPASDGPDRAKLAEMIRLGNEHTDALIARRQRQREEPPRG